MASRSESFQRLCDIMHKLRAPGGCPWDAEQSHASLVEYLIEEAYEVAEAVEAGQDDDLVKELGDVLLQVVFHSEIAEEEARFRIEDVLEAVSEKMISRHPHVFGDGALKDSRAVIEQWDRLKREERGTDSGLLDGIPTSLPALLRAQRLQSRAAGVGFDWEKSEDILDKIHEEVSELEEAGAQDDQQKREEEFGDLLFALVNWSRFSGLNSEMALQRANRKFCERFNYIEGALKKKGSNVESANLEEMDALWEKAKTDSGGRE